MTQARPLRLFVLIDALGWQFLEGRSTFCDFLTHRVPLRTILGFSSGAIPTILTGVPPAQNGHWNLFYYDPQGSPFHWLRFFSFLPDRLIDNRVSKKALKELGRRILGMGPLFECSVSPRLLPWFNYVEKRNIYDRGGITGASSIFDWLGHSGVPYRVYSYHHSSDQEIFKLARHDLENTDARFFFLYLSEMDIFLHNNCTDEGKWTTKLAWYNTELERVFRVAEQIDPDVRFTLFSDHGMTPVKKHYDVVKQIEALGYEMPRDYLAVYDSTMARFWFFNSNARDRIVERLKELPAGRILPDQELQQLGILFHDQRYGEVIFLMHPGWLLSRSDFNGCNWMPVGMHGYHPDDANSDAVFLSSHRPQTTVRNIADIYPCMKSAAQFI